MASGFPVYTLPAYGRMVADPIRFDAYRRALESSVRPGDVVVDLGAGPGIFSLVAARLGASRVWALEPDAVVAVARELVQRNGADGVVRTVRRSSTEVELEQRADVVVSDLRGVLPFFGGHLPSVIDARERLLRPGGRLIPEHDELWIEPVHAPEPHAALLGGFDGARLGLESPRYPRLDLRAAREMASHHWCRAELTAEACPVAARRLGRLEYRRLETPHFRGRAEWAPAELGRPAHGGAVLHGLAVWFDSRLTADIGFSNDPRRGKVLYGQAFFPFPEPVRAEAGDALEAGFSAHLVGEDYVFGWRFRVLREGRAAVEVDRSTFRASPLDGDELGGRASSRVPRPGAELEALRWLVEAVDGESRLGQLARGLTARFPELFADEHAALGWAADRLPADDGEKARIRLRSSEFDGPRRID